MVPPAPACGYQVTSLPVTFRPRNVYGSAPGFGPSISTVQCCPPFRPSFDAGTRSRSCRLKEDSRADDHGSQGYEPGDSYHGHESQFRDHESQFRDHASLGLSGVPLSKVQVGQITGPRALPPFQTGNNVGSYKSSGPPWRPTSCRASG